MDYRELNQITHPAPFPLPKIDELLMDIGNCSCFSTLDLDFGYQQIPIAEEDKTAFARYQGK